MFWTSGLGGNRSPKYGIEKKPFVPGSELVVER
jgi:hypothetical protein